MSLGIGSAVAKIAGGKTMPWITEALAKLLPAFPQWSRNMGPGPRVPHTKAKHADIVYFPACVSRMMGSSTLGKDNVMETVLRVARRAGFTPYLPSAAKGLCCSQIVRPHGFPDAQQLMANRVVEAMFDWSDGGRLPIMCDITSCARTLLHEMETEMWGDRRAAADRHNTAKYKKLRILDIAEWLHDDALPRLDVTSPRDRSSCIRPARASRWGSTQRSPRSAKPARARARRRLPQAAAARAATADSVIPRDGVGLRDEKAEFAGRSFDGAYSFAKSCEIVLSDNLPFAYESIVYLVDETTSAKR